MCAAVLRGVQARVSCGDAAAGGAGERCRWGLRPCCRVGDWAPRTDEPGAGGFDAALGDAFGFFATVPVCLAAVRLPADAATGAAAGATGAAPLGAGGGLAAEGALDAAFCFPGRAVCVVFFCSGLAAACEGDLEAGCDQL